MKKLFIAAGLSLGVIAAEAQQDIHFSQFYTSPMMINPGSCGMMNGDIRVNSNFRNQWGSLGQPFQTLIASVDAPILRTKLKENFIGIGATFYNDKAGDSKMTTGNYMMNLSYAQQIARDQYLAAGIQFGILQRSVSYGDLYWGNQFTGIAFDQTLPSGEIPPSASTGFDLNAGIYYNGYLSESILVFGGASGSHLTSPDLTFSTTADELFTKITIHGGAQIALKNTKMKLCPNFLTKFQGPNRIINAGTDLRFILREASRSTVFFEETSVDFGTYMRFGDALYFALRLNWGPLSVGAAYDLNISGLSVATSGNGAMEFMLTYCTALSKTGVRSTRFL